MMGENLFFGFILSYLGICFAGNQQEITFCKAEESFDTHLHLHVPKVSDLPCLCQLSTTNWKEPTNIHIVWASSLPPNDCGLNIEIKEKESSKNVECNYLRIFISLNDSTPVLLTLANNSESIMASFYLFTRSFGKIHIRCFGPIFSEDNASTFLQTLTNKHSFFKHTTLPHTLEDNTKDNILAIYISVPTAVLLIAFIIALIIFILIRKSRSKNNTTTEINECNPYETEALGCRQYVHVYDVINNTNNYEQ